MSAKDHGAPEAPTTEDPAAAHVGQEIESRFETHDVEAWVFETNYSNSEPVRDSARWGVVCQDCGRAQDFHIAVDSDTGTYDISEVYVESLEERPCKAYEIPDDVDTGEHTLVISDENPEQSGGSRAVHCADCGRTSEATRKEEFAGNYLERLAEFPCQDRLTSRELAGAVLYNSLPSYPDKPQVGIDNWTAESGNGWASEIDEYWWHDEVPVVILIKSRRGQRWVEFQWSPNANSRCPARRAPTISQIQYEPRNNEEKDFEAVNDVLTFMQQTNDLDREEFDNLPVEDGPAAVAHIIETENVNSEL